MIINFNIDMDDMMSFQKRYIQTSMAIRKVKRMLTFVFPLFILVFSFIAFYNRHSRIDIAFVAIVAVVCALWVIFIPKFFEKSSLRKAKKILSKPENAIMFGKFEMMFNDDNFEVKTPSSSSNLQWNSIRNIDETSSYFYLYLSEASAYIIPKQKISNDEADELRILFKTHYDFI